MSDNEFKEGDEVTYVPYGREYNAIVRGVTFMGGQYIYDLEHVEGERGNFVSGLSSGRSILESKFYVPHAGD